MQNPFGIPQQPLQKGYQQYQQNQQQQIAQTAQNPAFQRGNAAIGQAAAPYATTIERIMAMLSNPQRVGQQALQGIGNSMYAGVQGVGAGLMKMGSAFTDPNQNPVERVGNVIGGAVDAGREIAWIAPSAVMDSLANIDETKEIGQTMKAVPQFFADQSEKLYGKGGAYEQSINQLIPQGAGRDIMQGTADFMRTAGKPIMDTATKVAFLKMLQRAAQGKQKPQYQQDAEADMPYPKMKQSEVTPEWSGLDKAIKAAYEDQPAPGIQKARSLSPTPMEGEMKNINSPVFDLENSAQKGALDSELNPVYPKSTPQKTLYHGTVRELNEVQKTGLHGSANGTFGAGVYFTEDPKTANVYTQIGSSARAPSKNSSVITVDASDLNIKKLPYDSSEYRDYLQKNNLTSEDFTAQLKADGYDGAAFEGAGYTVIFDPKKVKITGKVDVKPWSINNYLPKKRTLPKPKK